LIDQYSIHVEHHIKTSPNQWLLSEYDSPDVTLSFNTFECQVTIADLYENIEFQQLAELNIFVGHHLWLW